MKKFQNIINDAFENHINTSIDSKINLNEVIEDVCDLIINSLNNGNKLIFFGNGGSAGDAQHISAEFTGRFVKERKALSAIALTTDTSAITAIGNDYGFEKIFSRQIEALAKKGDILFGISTSGMSLNVINGFISGKKIGTINIGLSGNGGGKMNNFTIKNIIVPKTNNTARIQELHILIGHIICEIIDKQF